MSRLVCLAAAILVLFPAAGVFATEPDSFVIRDGLSFTNARRPFPAEVIAGFVDSVFIQPDSACNIQPTTGLRAAARESLVIRAQGGAQNSAPYDERPNVSPNLGLQQQQQQPVMMLPPIMQGGPQWSGSQSADPLAEPPLGSQFGATGPQPFRLGWQSKFDLGYLPSETAQNAAGNFGEFGVFEFNGEMRHTMPLPNKWIWSFAPQLNIRSWQGPHAADVVNPVPPPQLLSDSLDLPGDVYRGGLDLSLTSPTMGAFTTELGFTPSIGTDLERSPGTNSWMFDARGAVFFRSNPQWLWMLGALYWDRVEDRVLPYGGFVFTPNDRLEIRAVFPNPQISWFVGTPFGVPYWVYVAGEYHIEAYEIQVDNANGTAKVRDQIQLQDWRFVLGLRSETNGMSSFLEGGWVLDRKATLRNAASDFDIHDGFIVRAGLKF